MKLTILVAGLAAAVAGSVEASRFNDPYEQFAVLGDSLADPGNLFFGLPPFTPAIGFPAPPYYRGQFSNGWNFAVRLQRNFEKDGKTTKNYAFGGARAEFGIDDELPDLPMQATFMLNDPFFTPTPQTLTLVNFGGNDILNAFRDPALTPESLAMTAQEAAFTMGAIILDLRDEVGLTDFILPNLGSVGAAPRLLYDYDPFYSPIVTPELADSATQQFNAALALVAQNLRVQGLNIFEVDVYTRLNQIIADPSIVGLDIPPNTIQSCGIPTFFAPDIPAVYDFSACIDDPGNAPFLFFDDVHPVRQIHDELANIVRADVRAGNMVPVPLPATGALLLVAAIGLGCLRRRSS